MANHKKRRAINQRSGCKLCRPWKINGVRWYANAPADQRVLQESVEDLEEECTGTPEYPFIGPQWPSRSTEEEHDEYVDYLKEYNVK
jgi:hypothetical protein